MKDILFITDFKNLESTINVNLELVNQLSSNFKNVYFINSGNLQFPKCKKVEDNLRDIKKLSNNHFINPKNFSEFDNFLQNKDVLIISNFGRSLNAIKINFFLKRRKIKIFQISNLGFFNVAPVYDFKLSFFPIIKHFFAVKFFKKFSVLLSNIGIFPKYEVRFISNKNIIDKINKNPLIKKIYKKKLLFSKKIVLINSKSYDLFKKNTFNISDDYIIHLDKEFNWPELIDFRGEYDQKKLNEYYYFLNRFLMKLSNDFKKKVIVCIHPGYKLEKFKTYFPKFDVIQFKTAEYIYKAFLVTMIDSSSIVDAILLKKKILALTSDTFGFNEKNYTMNNIQRYGVSHLDIEKDINRSSESILSLLEDRIPGYDRYIEQNICFDKETSGYKKIIKTLKEI